ncbi:MAG: zf-HC2 domain-containing protein [Acidimicrobiales bacterium]
MNATSGWATVTPQRLDANWRAIVAELDAPARSRIERALLAVRMPEPIARTLVATPALRRAWFVATGVALLFGLGAADTSKPGASLLMLLALAPMVPVVGVTLAYGPGSDPAHEVTLATPMSGLRLVLLRSTAVVACSMGAAGIATLLLRDKTWMSISWLVPSLALPAVCLALSTYVAPRRAAVLVAVFWLVPLSVVNRNVTDELVVFRQWGQLALATLAVGAAVVVSVRRETFDRLVLP